MKKFANERRRDYTMRKQEVTEESDDYSVRHLPMVLVEIRNLIDSVVTSVRLRHLDEDQVAVVIDYGLIDGPLDELVEVVDPDTGRVVLRINPPRARQEA
jgi:hypothetical protein